MHVADGVTGLFAPRSRNDRRREPAAFLGPERPQILHHILVCLDATALNGLAGEAWKEDFIFQMHVLDQIVGEFFCAGVKRAP